MLVFIKISCYNKSNKLDKGAFMETNTYIATFLENMNKKDPAQKVFHQAVKEVVGSLIPVLDQNPKYIKERILERIVEPERTIIFRVRV